MLFEHRPDEIELAAQSIGRGFSETFDLHFEPRASPALPALI
jgi:hypothetical protein